MPLKSAISRRLRRPFRDSSRRSLASLSCWKTIPASKAFHMARTGSSSRPCPRVFSSFCISCSSGICSSTRRSRSKSPHSSISSHENRLSCGIMAIRMKNLLGDGLFCRLPFYTMEVHFLYPFFLGEILGVSGFDEGLSPSLRLNLGEKVLCTFEVPCVSSDCEQRNWLPNRYAYYKQCHN